MATKHSVTQIIELAGGAAVIADASKGRIKKDAVYKWPNIGIPDRHWPIIIKLAEVSPDDLFFANCKARRVPSPKRSRSVRASA
ncbi:carph-isopro domain-containing protein [Brucella sp. BZ]|uniref:carph-isopro domain-containing protein n=1 Tax=Brucella sp. BZ TaxID=3381346 RepID=UPI0039E74B61